jgi:predicted ATPase
MTSFRDTKVRDITLAVSSRAADVCTFTLYETRGGAILAEGRAGLTAPRSALEPNLTALASYIEQPLAPQVLIDLGQGLARLLPGPIYDRLRFEIGTRVQQPVRLWLDMRPEVWSELPWEYLCLPADTAGCGDRTDGCFPCLHPRFHILRCGAGKGDVTPATSLEWHPLKLLIAWADPCTPTHARLSHLPEELKGIRSSLETLSGDHVQIRELDRVTPARLKSVLEEWRPHILHFIGHGDQRKSGYRLILDGGEQGSYTELYADQLAEWLAHTQTRLVVLSACITGVGEHGIAATLSRKGVPAIVGTQLPFRDASAGRFASAFYNALAAADPLDVALGYGRQAVREFGADWGVPVLYASEPTGLFRLPPPPRRTNLTPDQHPFIGRANDLLKLRGKLRRGSERLITITGMGGLGKSRLAEQVALELLEHFQHGVWRVDCEPLSEPHDLLAEICAALRLDVTRAGSASDIGRKLAGRHLLLLLDGFESCAAHAALLEDILDEAPEVSILVTSRQVLNQRSEFEYPLQTLPTVERVKRQLSDSVALFVEAAIRADPEFKVADHRAKVRDLCEELEGIPLAIVLAAGRLRRHFTLDELCNQIRERRFEVLRRGHASDRHATLQGVIEDSFAALPESAQSLLVALCIFPGSFGYSDAQSVCGEADDSEAVYDGLPLLRDHSFLQTSVQTSGMQDRTHFRMLETVRDFLKEYASPEKRIRLEACRERFAVHYTQLAQQIDKRRHRGEWEEASVQFWRESVNIRQAVEYSIRYGKQALLLELADAVARTYFEAGLWQVFEALADAAQQAAYALERPDVLMRLRGLQGALARTQKQEDAARQLWQQRLALAEEARDTPVVADTLIELAVQAHDLKDRNLAHRLLGMAMRICIADRLYGLVATVYATESELALADGNAVLAREKARAAEAVLTGDEDGDLLPYIYRCLGRVYFQLEDFPEADRVLRVGIRWALAGERTLSVCRCLLEYGDLNATRGYVRLAACAYSIVMNIHVQLATPLRDHAQAGVRRIEEEHGAAGVERWLRPIRAKDWRTATFRLLEQEAEL